MDNGRSALLGAFWPQRRRRRQKQRAAAHPTISQVAVLGIPARAHLGLDYIRQEGVRAAWGSTCSQRRSHRLGGKAHG